MKAEYASIKIIFICVLVVILLYTLYANSLPKPNLELVDMPFHIERQNKEIDSVSGLPLTLYQSWGTNKVSLKMREAIYSILDMNPELEYYLYSDQKCLEFIEDNFSSEVVDAFNVFKPGAYKSDLWRYCILYIKGGLYLDIKYYAVAPIVQYLREHPTVYVQGIPSICHETSIFLREAYNGFMVSPPNNRVYKDCIDDIVNSTKLKLYKASPLDITGPCLQLKMLKKYKSDAEIRAEPFTYSRPIFTLTWIDNIYHNDVKVFTSYKEYRWEQKSNKKNYYFVKWLKGDVYN